MQLPFLRPLRPLLRPSLLAIILGIATTLAIVGCAAGQNPQGAQQPTTPATDDVTDDVNDDVNADVTPPPSDDAQPTPDDAPTDTADTEGENGEDGEDGEDIDSTPVITPTDDPTDELQSRPNAPSKPSDDETDDGEGGDEGDSSSMLEGRQSSEPITSTKPTHSNLYQRMIEVDDSKPTDPMTSTGAEKPSRPIGKPDVGFPRKTDIVTGVARVSKVDIAILESDPPQVNVTAFGNFPDGCTKMGEVIQERVGNTFAITLTTRRPKGMMCTMALVPFEHTVTLEDGKSGNQPLDAGKYRVVVNGVEEQFTLK
jgi:hypothetical protein